jgi:hypothetical protein
MSKWKVQVGRIATLALLVLLLTPALPARADTGRQIAAAGFFTLAGLQIPAAAFEFASYSRLNTELGGWEGDASFGDKAHSAATANLAGGILHSAKFLAWTLAGMGAMGEVETLPLAMVLLNGGLDMGNAIMGVTSGAILLGAKRNADVAGTPMGEAATLSGVVHLVFGSISAIITLPELLIGLFGVIATADLDRPARDVRFAISPTGFTLSGRF